MVEMTSVFKKTVRPILSISKWFGIINMSYVLEPAGLLVRDTNSSYYSVLEISRMGALLISTFLVYHSRTPFMLLIVLFKFWFVIVAARISETSLIKLINGIIEYDRKIGKLPRLFIDQQRSYSATYWKKTIIILFTHFVVFEMFELYASWPRNDINFPGFVVYLFTPPFAIDFAVVIISCFYLYNIDIRFQSLNDFWKCIPAGLVAIPEQWTHCQIAVLVENIRLLHAELSDLLNIFSMGYGSLLLGFFAFCFVNIMVQFFFSICVNVKTLFEPNIIKFTIKSIIPQLLNVQMVLFMMSVTILASRIHEKRRKILSYLRSNRISNLPVDIKRQVKLFMNQISVSDSDNITAFGFFNINLHLVISILVLILTGVSTLIQMREYPIVLNLVNDTQTELST